MRADVRIWLVGQRFAANHGERQVVAGETGLLVPPRTIAPLGKVLSALASDGAHRCLQ